MKLENSNSNELSLDFETPEKGVSIVEIDEGIEKYYNESSGKTTLRIPLVIIRSTEGPESNEGLKLMLFVPIETGWGEKQIRHILTITGLISAFSKKFNGEVDATDEKFINSLKLKLLGKCLKVEHDKRMGNNGRERAIITKIMKVDTDNLNSKQNVDSGPKVPPEEIEDWSA